MEEPVSKLGFVIAFAWLGVSFPAFGAGDRTYPEGRAPAVSSQAFPSLTTIYRGSGVSNTSGANNTGVATSFHCSNFNANTQQVRFLLRDNEGVVVSNQTFNLTANQTFTASTHATAIFFDVELLAEGISIAQGSIVIAATSAAIHCSASIVDAAATSPNGVDLHLVRFNAVAGSQE
jgi:hypothetical protein